MFTASLMGARSGGPGELMLMILPINSYFNNNNGHGDITIDNISVECKGLSTYRTENAPTITCENATNRDIKADLQEHFKNVINKISDFFPILEPHLNEIIKNDPGYMLSPYTGYYDPRTFNDKNTGEVKVYTIHNIWNKIYSFNKYLDSSERVEFKIILTNKAIASTIKIFKEILPRSFY